MKLMTKVHRDHGGSDWFAKELNAAKGLVVEQ